MYAEIINPKVQGLLRDFPAGRVLGVIPMDFVGNTGDGGDSLENLIIEHQRHQLPGTMYGGMPPWLRATFEPLPPVYCNGRPS